MKKKILVLFVLLPLLAHAGSEVKDVFWSEPQGNFGERKQNFLDFTVKHGEKNGRMAVFHQLVRVESGLSVEEEYIQQTIDIIYRNRDCNDFEINGLVRLLNMDSHRKLISAEIRKKAEQCLMDFKYWWDDARRDTTYKCYHTENHQALYHTAELLAGQLLKDKTFKSGMKGTEHIAHAEERLLRWLNFRFRFGFSEWLSATYYDVDIMLLANLYDFAENPVIRKQAAMVLDLLFFDLALNNFRGTLGATTGRVYASRLISGHEGTSPATKIAFGVGQFLQNEYMCGTAMALSSYRCPEVIAEIATDYKKVSRNRQRASINVEDAGLYGLSYDNELDVHLFWGMQEFIHPQVVNMSKMMSEKYDAWPYRNYDHYIKRYDDQIKTSGKITDARLDRFALSEANIETYRTPDYMLSTANDYRPGAIGYQQHIWQATLADGTLIFSNHPGSSTLKGSPNYWAGNAIMPRAAQHKNVAIVIHKLPEREGRKFSHVHFPKNRFDELQQKGSWVFGRKGNGYIAIYSQLPTEWKTDDDGNENDLVANGLENTWICEMGNKAEWKSFSKFIQAIEKASVTVENGRVIYKSPSVGKTEFGWEAPFRVKNKEIDLRHPFRYDNLYCKAPFAGKSIEIKKGKKKLLLDFENLVREEKK